MGTVSLVVADESEAQRYQGINAGLSTILVRLSGLPDVLESEAAKTILSQASTYLIQFSYEALTNPAGEVNEYAALLKDDYFRVNPKALNTPEANKSLKILKLTFGQQLLLKKLQDGGDTVWDTNRPEVMLWWVSEEMGVRKVLNEGEVRESRTAFNYFAEQRAVPIKFPLMDLQDQSLVNSSDIWGGFSEPLLTANKRYGLNTWVQGKNYYSENEWFATWEVHVLGEVKAFKTQSPSLRALQKAVIGSIAKVLANEYGIVTGLNDSEIYITVSDVRSLDDFSKLKRYLDNLFVVKRIEMRLIKEDQVSFKLYLKEDFEKFKKLIDLDKKMYQVINSSNAETISPNTVNLSPIVNTAETKLNNSADNTNLASDSPIGISPNALNSATSITPQAPKISYIQYRWADK